MGSKDPIRHIPSSSDQWIRLSWGMCVREVNSGLKKDRLGEAAEQAENGVKKDRLVHEAAFVVRELKPRTSRHTLCVPWRSRTLLQ